MLVTEIVGNIYTKSYNRKIIPLYFEWFEVEKKRIKKIAEDGKEFGIAIGETLHDGDIVADVDDRLYVCEIKKCELTKISVSSIKEMANLCFELGNRHLSIKIEENYVLVPYDRPTFNYLQNNGFIVEKIDAKFADYAQYKAHVTIAKNALHITRSASVVN